jgi:isopentenyl-diphosphate delta-isomerase
MGEEITLVDLNDNVIGSIDRDQINQNHIFRIASLWLTNSKGEVLLAKRALTKKSSAGKWGPAVSGTVAKDESYEETIYREAKEEINLSGIKFTKSIKQERLTFQNRAKYFNQWFKAKADKDLDEFKIDSNEVAQIKWFTLEEIEKQIKTNPEMFVTSIVELIEGKIKF